MSNTKLIAYGLALLLATSLGFNAGYLSKKPETNTIVRQDSSGGGNLGAVASPDVPSPWLKWGGVRYWNAGTESLTQATTTICALQSPASTSTLIMGSVQITTGTTTASAIVLAKAASAYATTTALGASVAVAANGSATVVASSTQDSKVVFGPSQYLVVGVSGGVGTFSSTGSCRASWVQN